MIHLDEPLNSISRSKVGGASDFTINIKQNLIYTGGISQPEY